MPRRSPRPMFRDLEGGLEPLHLVGGDHGPQAVPHSGPRLHEMSMRGCQIGVHRAGGRLDMRQYRSPLRFVPRLDRAR